MEQKEINLVLTRMAEIEDDMTSALLNLAKVINQQKTLMDVVSHSEKSADFVDFIDGVSKDVDTKQKEYDALLEHRNMLRALTTKAKFAQGKEKEAIMETLFNVFVIFNVINKEMIDSAV